MKNMKNAMRRTQMEMRHRTTITNGGAKYILKRISNYRTLTLRVWFYSEVVLVYPTNKIKFPWDCFEISPKWLENNSMALWGFRIVDNCVIWWEFKSMQYFLGKSFFFFKYHIFILKMLIENYNSFYVIKNIFRKLSYRNNAFKCVTPCTLYHY